MLKLIFSLTVSSVATWLVSIWHNTRLDLHKIQHTYVKLNINSKLNFKHKQGDRACNKGKNNK